MMFHNVHDVSYTWRKHQHGERRQQQQTCMIPGQLHGYMVCSTK